MSHQPPPQPPRVNSEEAEQLSAFLDHELDEAATQEITAALSQRAEVRQEAESLRKTWELLDYLPRPEAPASFTENTLTRLESTKGLLLRQGVKWKRFAIAGWAACLIVAALGSFLITYFWQHPVAEESSVIVNDVVPAESSPEAQSVSSDAATTHLPKLKKDRDKQSLKPWQAETLQRNEKLRRELARIVAELQPKMKREDRQRLAAAAKEGGLGYIILVIDLSRQYQIPLPDLLPAVAVPEFPPLKRPAGNKAGAE
jgi:hypothetical protein